MLNPVQTHQQSECKLGTVVRLLRCNLKVPGLNMEITFPQMGVRVFHLTISRLCNGLVPCILLYCQLCLLFSILSSSIMIVILRWCLSFFFFAWFHQKYLLVIDKKVLAVKLTDNLYIFASPENRRESNQ